MIIKNYDESIWVNYNPNWPHNPYRILIIGGSGSVKNNVLLNSKKYQCPDIDKIYLYVKDPFESKYQLLISGREKIRKNFKKSKKNIDYSQTIKYVYENIEGCTPTKK